MSSNPKKTKGYFVPSRYKIAAAAVASRSNEGTIFSQTSVSPEILNSTILNQTTTCFKSGKESKVFMKTSTPGILGSHRTLPTWDSSTIADSSVSSAISCTNSTILDSTITDQKSSKFFCPSSSDSKKPNRKTKEVEIDSLFAEYLQIQILVSETSKTFTSRQEDSFQKIFQVWHYIQTQLERLKEASNLLNCKRYFTELLSHLQRQDEMLLPIMDIIPSLEKQYKEISLAINSVRGSMEVKNLSLSNTNNAEIIESVLHAKNLLLSIIGSVHKHDSVVSSSNIVKNYIETGKAVLEEIHRISHLIEEANCLVVDEAFEKTCLIQQHRLKNNT